MDRTVLFVSPSPDHAQLLASMLTPIDLDLKRVECVADARSSLGDSALGVVLSEASLRDGDWHSVLSAAFERSCGIQVLVTRTDADAHFWTDALEAGAYDIVTQPFHAAEVQRLVLSAWLKFETAGHSQLKMGVGKAVPAVFAARAAG